MIPLAECILCPMCRGTGQEIWTQNDAKLCTLCEGRRWIPTVACRGCGRPAYRYWPPKQQPIVQFCGREDCLKVLIKLHKPRVTVVEAARMLAGPMQIAPLRMGPGPLSAARKIYEDTTAGLRNRVDRDDEDDMSLYRPEH